ncbi:ferritin-like protein [Sedimentitalea sp.]|uniref:ferritin-like domain-containing protein n=1 Tax=Sedimentitalea sp. TaxID=2048915 RepID=UPI00329776EE
MIVDLLVPSPTLESVQTSLQNAIELEHATIPLYLYALYSLDESKNAEIAEIIESVVVEEMLHMTLASNILNAVGGSPNIDTPGFIPTYPGALPGGVQSDLSVGLAPFSMHQLDKFLEIEEPEDPLVFKSMALEAATQVTIGQFYTAISTAIASLGDGIFAKTPRNQIGPDLMFESVVVTDVKSAQQAIDVIIDQGEGTSTSPFDGNGDEFAHYYRFMQVKKGHKLVEVPGGIKPEDKFAYTGAPIVLDACGVFSAPENPGDYKPGSAQAFLNDTFNYTYTSLLNALHLMFNGDSSQTQFNRAIGLMMSLKEQAKAMMSGLPNPDPKAGDYVGPSFKYQPVNPAIEGK